MPIVTRFSRVTKDRVGRPKNTECGFCPVEIDGTAYLLLETYGAADRAMPGKVSQSLHLDRHRAAELKALLETAVPWYLSCFRGWVPAVLQGFREIRSGC